jgi:hypothetical protein
VTALDRLARKRRDRRTQTQPDPPFAVESCECLTEGPFALLRVVGTGTTQPTTLVGEGESPEKFEPLPQPGAPAADGTWRMAFALPAELGRPGTRLWLHDGGVYLVDLIVPPAAAPVAAPKRAQEPVAEQEPEPQPEPVAVVEPARVPPKRAAEAEADHEPADPSSDPRAKKLVEAWAEAAGLREKLTDREDELARALKELLDARHNVEPLRERAEELTIDLANVRRELEQSHSQGREARLRATALATELDAVKAQLAQAEPRVAEAERARKEAERETTAARDEVVRLERELTSARVAVENAIRDAEEKLQDTRREATAAQDRLTAEAAEQQQAADELREKVTKLEESKNRRRGVGRRTDDKELVKLRAELEAQIAEKQQRIAELEQQAESFAQRRDDAVGESLRERITALEEEVRQHTTCNDDLRALLESERELVATARADAKDLKRQLATAKASRLAAAAAANGNGNGNGTGIAVAAEPVPAEHVKAPAEAPPWSALDDELLARIEKAKALTG